MPWKRCTVGCSSNNYQFAWLQYYYHAAAQTEVLSLQQICIDCVAKYLKSPADAWLLPLSDRVKTKVSKVVFDPDTDFCFNPLSRQELQRDPESDILHCLDDYKELICAVR